MQQSQRDGHFVVSQGVVEPQKMRVLAVKGTRGLTRARGGKLSRKCEDENRNFCTDQNKAQFTPSARLPGLSDLQAIVGPNGRSAD